MNYKECFAQGKRELEACVSTDSIIGCYDRLINTCDKNKRLSPEQRRTIRISLGEYANILMRNIVDKRNDY